MVQPAQSRLVRLLSEIDRPRRSCRVGSDPLSGATVYDGITLPRAAPVVVVQPYHAIHVSCGSSGRLY